MTVLVIGATGTTGRPLVAALRAAGAEARPAGRRPGPDGVFFDWADPGTHGAALRGADRLYLVAPVNSLDPMPSVDPFLAAARVAGVRRAVLLGSLAVLRGAAGPDHLRRAVERFPEGAVLRPSGFMQNTLGRHPVAVDIREHGVIRSAAGDGRLGWIDAADIAATAATLLLAEEPPACSEYLLTGPEALSYTELAAVLTEVTGRPVRHLPVSAGERTAQFRAAGMSAAVATALAGFDTDIAAGTEQLLTATVAEVTGRPPRSFRDFVLAHHLHRLDPSA